MTRHYGLDWLRIGAFAILILYHVGMVFVPWDFHVKLPGAAWIAIPMLASNPWRLALLFVVSGYASRALLARSTGSAAFAWSRTKRLLVPLAFGVAVIVPPQPWVELVTKAGYPAGFAYFWLHDYFRFGTVAGIPLPTWNHLWFVGYLWLYTLAAAAIVAAAPALVRNAAQRLYDRIFGSLGAVAWPTLWYIAVNQWLFSGERETHALVGDGVAHATYLPAFLFGFALAGSAPVLGAFVRWCRLSVTLALASYAVVVWIEWRWPLSTMPRPFGTVFAIARAVEGWAAIAALAGVAERYWNRDHRWRATLTEAVFPFYLVHQTIIVVVAWWLTGATLPPAANFAILIVATIAGCVAFYLVGRRQRWLRPLIGLRALPSRKIER